MSKQRATAAGGMETSFGFRQVGEGDKQSLVNEVFHRVAGRYDLMNDLMSAGMHRLWKDALVAWLNPPKRGGWKVLDVAGGTGDIAFRIVEASGRNAHATVLDINGSMLAVGRDRADKLGLAEQHRFRRGQCRGNCPSPTTASTPIRSPSASATCRASRWRLAEAYRVLKPGGRFLCLEFSEVDMPLLDRAYEAWSFNAIPRIGKMVAGDGEPYAYLVESIRKFPNQENFAAMMRRPASSG